MVKYIVLILLLIQVTMTMAQQDPEAIFEAVPGIKELFEEGRYTDAFYHALITAALEQKKRPAAALMAATAQYKNREYLEARRWLEVAQYTDSFALMPAVDVMYHCVTLRSDFDSHIREGFSFEEKGNITEAAIAFTDAWKIIPARIDVGIKAATLLLKSGHPVDALPILEKIKESRIAPFAAIADSTVRFIHKNILLTDILAKPPYAGYSINDIERHPEIFLIPALRHGDERLLKKAVLLGADINHYAPHEGRYVLHEVVFVNHVDFLNWAVVNGLRLDVIDTAGRTPLFCCLEYNNMAMANTLVKYGADVSLAGKKKEAPVVDFIGTGNIDAVLFLLQHGANPYMLTNGGLSLLQYAVYMKDTVMVNALTAIHLDVNEKTMYGFTALHIAAQNRDLFMVKTLLKQNANKAIKDDFGRYAWHLAARNKNKRIKKLLMPDIGVGQKMLLWLDVLRFVKNK
ncbi:MAG: ankyrin repeat domain-containing protein [Bacteroidales bacterium]|nr:ankyrin repeat domain-containing protein [Bacteroidales bacterium]